MRVRIILIEEILKIRDNHLDSDGLNGNENDIFDLSEIFDLLCLLFDRNHDGDNYHY